MEAFPRWVLSSALLSVFHIRPHTSRPLHTCDRTTWDFWVASEPLREVSLKKKKQYINGDPIKTYPGKLSPQKLTLLSHFTMCKCGMKWNKWWNSSLNVGNAWVNSYVSTPCCLLALLSWQSCLPQVSAIPILVLKTKWELEHWGPTCDEVVFLCPGLSQTALCYSEQKRGSMYGTHPYPTKEKILLPWRHCIESFDIKASGSTHLCRVLQIIPSKSWNQFAK